jgi:hypothetical protein
VHFGGSPRSKSTECNERRVYEGAGRDRFRRFSDHAPVGSLPESDATPPVLGCKCSGAIVVTAICDFYDVQQAVRHSERHLEKS